MGRKSRPSEQARSSVDSRFFWVQLATEPPQFFSHSHADQTLWTKQEWYKFDLVSTCRENSVKWNIGCKRQLDVRTDYFAFLLFYQTSLWTGKKIYFLNAWHHRTGICKTLRDHIFSLSTFLRRNKPSHTWKVFVSWTTVFFDQHKLKISSGSWSFWRVLSAHKVCTCIKERTEPNRLAICVLKVNLEQL